MKLLFDHHLSRKLVARLADCFPDSSHVVIHGMDCAEDSQIWTFAATHGYTIVTKDSDFEDIATIRGAPPKVIWLRMGNRSTMQIADTLRQNQQMIQQFIQTQGLTILELV